jgi:hypothetical protein
MLNGALQQTGRSANQALITHWPTVVGTVEISGFSPHRACLGRFRVSELRRICSHLGVRRSETDRGEPSGESFNSLSEGCSPDA